MNRFDRRHILYGWCRQCSTDKFNRNAYHANVRRVITVRERDGTVGRIITETWDRLTSRERSSPAAFFARKKKTFRELFARRVRRCGLSGPLGVAVSLKSLNRKRASGDSCVKPRRMDRLCFAGTTNNSVTQRNVTSLNKRSEIFRFSWWMKKMHRPVVDNHG